MGFRNYDPGLNRFLTRDVYGGALADMSLATDPYTGNRYVFAGGNPISFVELDGHLFGIDISLSDVGHAALDVAGMVPVVGEVADVANGVWYMAEGNYVDGALSMAAAIPGAGNAVTAAKWAKKGAKAADAVKSGKKASNAKHAASKTTAKPKAQPKAPKGKKGGACKKPKKNSFVPGTKVLMADGSTKNIEDLKEGEYVLASDPETDDLQAREITDTRRHSGVKHLVTLTVDPDGKGGDARPATITATDEHPFWLPDFAKWVNAEDLEPGMWLQTSAGTWVQITAIDEAHRTQRVHNLTVEGQHTYYVLAGTAPVLVHNVNKPIPGVCGVNGEPVYSIPAGSSGGAGAYKSIPKKMLKDYNIGKQADPALPMPMCSYCRTNTANAVDHVQPRINGGDLTDPNTVPACTFCNSSKKNRPAPLNPPPNYSGQWPPSWWPSSMSATVANPRVIP